MTAHRLAMLAALTLASSVAACAAEPAGPATAQVPEIVTVTLNERAVSRGTRIMLGEVANIDGPDETVRKLSAIDLGRAAGPARERKISQAEIRAALRADAQTIRLLGSDSVAVTAMAQRVSSETLSESAIAAVRKALKGLSDIEASVEVISAPSEVLIRPGAYEVSPELPPVGWFSGARTIRVRVLVDSAWAGDALVGLRVRLFRKMPIAARRIEAGESVDAAMLNFESRECSIDDAIRPLDVLRLNGKRARAAIPAGKIVEERLLENPPVIKKGERVEVTVVRGSLVIRTFAEAKTDAGEGDSVRVRLMDSGAEILAKVAGPGRVEL